MLSLDSEIARITENNKVRDGNIYCSRLS